MSSKRRSDALPFAAALVTVTLWSSSFVGIRAVGNDLPAGALALGRLLVGSIVLGVMVSFRREPLPPIRDLPAIAACGLLWFGLYNVALNTAEHQVDAGTAAMIINVGPLLIAILAGKVLGEGFPRVLLAGCALAFTGTIVIGLTISGHNRWAVWGIALCVVAAIGYACGAVIQKPLLTRISALQVTWLACTAGALACLPYTPELVGGLRHSTAAVLAWTVYLGIGPTAIAFSTWAYALARTSAGRMGATMYLVAPCAIVLAWTVLDEMPSPLALLGGALCLAGVALVRNSENRIRDMSIDASP